MRLRTPDDGDVVLRPATSPTPHVPHGAPARLRRPRPPPAMMVAAHSDQGQDGRFPSDDVRAELQAALGAFVRSGGGAADEGTVCAALERMAGEAHARQLHGEHLLVAFKRLWSEMPEVRAFREAGARQRLLDRLVTLCIDAYYRRG